MLNTGRGGSGLVIINPGDAGLASEIHGALFLNLSANRLKAAVFACFAYFGAGPSGARFRRTVPRLVRALVGCRHRHHDEWRHRTASLQGRLAARPPMWLMPPARRFSKLCAARGIATGWKSIATSFPKAARFPAPGPRRRAVCREIFPAAPAVRRSWPMWLAPASRPVSTCGHDKQSVTIRPQAAPRCLPCRFICAIDKIRYLSATRCLSRHDAARRESLSRNMGVGRKIKRLAVQDGLLQ